MVGDKFTGMTVLSIAEEAALSWLATQLISGALFEKRKVSLSLLPIYSWGKAKYSLFAIHNFSTRNGICSFVGSVNPWVSGIGEKSDEES